MGRWSGRVMGQKGFFDVERRLAAISSKGDPLEAIKKIVRWEDFRADIEAMTQTEPEERKSNAGRKPYDALLKFKIVVLQSLHNLSDEQTEYLIRDRFSFMRFLDLEIEDPVPDATTIWLFREALMEGGLIDRLFARFGQHLEAAGYIARGGQIIDATIVSVPKQRNTKEENEAIKAGKTPEGWEQRPAKNAQKPRPLGGHVGEAGHSHAMRQPPRDGRFHEIGRQKGKRDRHIDLPNAAPLALGDAFRICVRVGKKFVEPAAASRNRCDQERAGLRAYRTSVLRWKPRGQKNLPAPR